MKSTLHGKCPRCSPNGGACFTRSWDDNGNPIKKCNNCNNVLRRRTVHASGKPTASQQRVIDRVANLFGVMPDVKMIGRKAFIMAENPARNWILGNSLCGNIGPRGSFKINFYRLGGDKPLTDYYALDSYLRGPDSKVEQ